MFRFLLSVVIHVRLQRDKFRILYNHYLYRFVITIFQISKIVIKKSHNRVIYLIQVFKSIFDVASVAFITNHITSSKLNRILFITKSLNRIKLMIWFGFTFLPKSSFNKLRLKFFFLFSISQYQVTTSMNINHITLKILFNKASLFDRRLSYHPIFIPLIWHSIQSIVFWTIYNFLLFKLYRDSRCHWKTRNLVKALGY